MKHYYHRSSGSWYANVLNSIVRMLRFIFLVFVALLIYLLLLDDILSLNLSHWWAFLAFWLFTAYIVLPRVNRRLSKLYLPNYFIGRARTGDGLLSDPVNLAVRGSEDQLIQAMQKAGWTQAEPLTFKSSVKMALSSIRGSHYPHAPVSTLYLLNQPHNFAFQREINGNPRKRHHVRFWKTPQDWWLPGGYQVDWLGAATYDKHVGLALYTGQITHKIDADIDAERDFVVDTIKRAKVPAKVEVVKHFTTSFHTRNGGGDHIHTDGSLPFITLK